jgi:hypothetical protein
MKVLIDNQTNKQVFYRHDRVQSIVRTIEGKEVSIRIMMDCGLVIAFRKDVIVDISKFYNRLPGAIFVTELYPVLS